MEERNRPSSEDFVKPTDEYSKFKNRLDYYIKGFLLTENRYSLNQIVNMMTLLGLIYANAIRHGFLQMREETIKQLPEEERELKSNQRGNQAFEELKQTLEKNPEFAITLLQDPEISPSFSKVTQYVHDVLFWKNEEKESLKPDINKDETLCIECADKEQNNQNKIAELEAKLHQHFNQFIRQQSQQVQTLTLGR